MPNERGFTLVEMMVALGIGSLVLVLAVTSLGSVSSGYDRNTNGVAAEREARAVLTLAAEDLAKAVAGGEPEFERDGGPWPLDRMGFLGLQPDDAQTPEQRVGDLCGVVYYVRDLVIGGDTVRCLPRGFRGSDETFATVESGTVETLYEPESRDEPVAFGVLSFEAEPLVRGESGELRE
jgi:prepilin-type N-terminal cleavage/methylation domain-containing protein